MKEFGTRRPMEAVKPVQPEKPVEKNFATDRPMFDRLRKHNPRIDELLSAWDAVDAQKRPETWIDDEKAKRNIEQQLYNEPR